MKKLFGKSSKKEDAAPPPPPPPVAQRAPPPQSAAFSASMSGSGQSSRSLSEKQPGGTDEGFGSSRAIPQDSQLNSTSTFIGDGGGGIGVSEIPPRKLLEPKLRAFYLKYEPAKAQNLEKILEAVNKKGLDWLQDGLERKYNAKLNFDTQDDEYDEEPVETEDEVGDTHASQPPVVVARAPPSQPPERYAPPPPAVAPRQISPKAASTRDIAQAMFINNQPPTSFAGTADPHAVVYPDAASALKSKGLQKYVAPLSAKGIVAYEDIAKIEEDPADPLWASMPPFPDKKAMRNLIATVKDYVASTGNAGAPQSGSTPFDDHPDAVLEASSSFKQPSAPVHQQPVQPAGAFVLPPPPPAGSQRRPSVMAKPLPPPPPAQAMHEEDGDVDSAFAVAEEAEISRKRMEAEEARKRREEEEEEGRAQRQREEQEEAADREAQRMKKEQQQDAAERKRKESQGLSGVAKPPPPPPQGSHAVAAPKRKQQEAAVATASSVAPTVKLDDTDLKVAEREVVDLKAQVETQTHKLDEITTLWERLVKELDEAQVQAEREKDRLDEINRNLADAKMRVDSLKAKHTQEMQRLAKQRELDEEAAAERARKVNEEAEKAEHEEPIVDVEEEGEVAEMSQKTELEQAVEEVAAAVPVQKARAEVLRPREENKQSEEARQREEAAAAASAVYEKQKAFRTNDQSQSDKPATGGSDLSKGSLSRGNSFNSFGGSAAESHAVSNSEIASEATTTKLRHSGGNSAVAREKTDEVCDHYELDMKAAKFGQCLCGHAKSDHKISATAPAWSRQASDLKLNKSPSQQNVKKDDQPVPTQAPVATKPTFVAKDNMYPALEPCENFEQDPQSSTTGMCVCGHQKVHHRLISPTVDGPKIPGAPGTRRGSDLTGSKPPPPARRPSVLTAGSGRSLGAAEIADLQKSASDPLQTPSVAPPPSEGDDMKRSISDPADAIKDEHRRRLVSFYSKHNPEKLGEVDTILEKFKGKEATMFKKLKEKYPDADI